MFTCILKSENYSDNKQVLILAIKVGIHSNTSKIVDKFQIHTYETTFPTFKSLLNKWYLAYINAYGLVNKGGS